MRKTNTFLTRYFIVLALTLFCFVSLNEANAQENEVAGDTGFKKQGKRAGSFKKLKLRTKKRVKLNIKIKTKKTKQQLEEERLQKLKNKKRQPKARSKSRSAAQAADEQRARMRLTSIKQYVTVLPNMPTDTDEDKKRKAEMYFRLAEEYWQHSKFLNFKAMEKHNVVMEKWDIKCRKLNDARKCPKAPAPKLAKSEAYRGQAIDVYKKVVKLFPTYARGDQVTFILALNLMETKKYKEGIKRFKQLVKKYPKSPFVPESYTSVANYYFNNNKVNDALTGYRKAYKVATARLKLKSTTTQQKIPLRGTQLRSIYYIGWCDFNIGDYEKTLKAFQKVIKLSKIYKKTKESKVLLLDEALRDLIRVYAKLEITGDAHKYFKRSMGAKFAYKATKKLARRYYIEGNYAQSIKTYRLLMGLNSKGKADTRGPEMPVFQNNVVRSAEKILKPDQIQKEVVKLVGYFKDNHPWNSKWRGNKKIFEEAKDRAEQTILEYATKYHRKAQEEKKSSKKREIYYDFAVNLYGQYLEYFPKSESAYELRFFYAEILYYKGDQKSGRKKRKRATGEAAKYYARAARQYYLVTKMQPRGAYIKQSAFAELLCYEKLAGRSGATDFKPKEIKIRINPKTGKPSWKKDKINKWDERLLDAYGRYLKVIKKKDERLMSFFKMGSIYYSYKHYLRSMKIFSKMAKEFPNHELSRRAAFMILYSYQDLKQWAELEDNARLFIKDRKLTKNKKFKSEMYGMIMRSTFFHIRKIKEKKLSSPEIAKQFQSYEQEFGINGPWYKKGFKMSPKAPNSLALAGFYYTKDQKVIEAIKVKEKLLKTYGSENPAFARKHKKIYDKNTKLFDMITYEVAQQYEQIANYENAAKWYERFVFGLDDPMKAKAKTEEAKPKKSKRRRKRRSRRRGKKKASPKKTAAVGGAKRQQKVNAAVYKAAAYRRSLEQFDKALFLYNYYIKKFPQAKDLKTIFLAIAKEIYEDNSKWKKSSVAYKTFLNKYQPSSITSYLNSSRKIFAKNLTSRGELWVMKKLKKVGGGVKSKSLTDEKLIYVHSRLAHIHRMNKETSAMIKEYTNVSALGYLMFERKIPVMGKASQARDAYAEARFFLAERRRKSFAAIKFSGISQHRDKKILKRLIKIGKELNLDYERVATLGMPRWTLASVFRKGEINHLFSKKLLNAPPPKSLRSQQDRQMYKMIMENTALPFEDRAIDAYDAVLDTSAKLGVYNDWVRKCETARNDLKRQKGRINPLTILSQRKSYYYLVESSLLKMKIRKAAPVMEKKSPVKEVKNGKTVTGKKIKSLKSKVGPLKKKGETAKEKAGSAVKKAKKKAGSAVKKAGGGLGLTDDND